jgi:predicted HicB family RNase H-like nuclease
MIKKDNDIKTFNLRIPRNLWVFLRNISTITDTSLNAIITKLIENHKKKLEKKEEKTLTE